MKQISEKRKEAIKLERKLYAILLKKCGGFCMTCGRLPDFRGLQLAHVIPKSLGGKTTYENCRLLCAKCHFTKYHRLKEAR